MRGGMLVVAMAVGIAACATGGPPEGEARVASMCRSYATTLSVLAEARAAGELSSEQVASVDAARGIANPICDADRAAAVHYTDELADALRRLSRIEQEVEQ